MFDYVLYFSAVLHIYRIIPAAFNFKMREIIAKHIFNIAYID